MNHISVIIIFLPVRKNNKIQDHPLPRRKLYIQKNKTKKTYVYMYVYVLTGSEIIECQQCDQLKENRPSRRTDGLGSGVQNTAKYETVGGLGRGGGGSEGS